MIFSDDEDTERMLILASIDGFMTGLGLTNVHVQKTKIIELVRGMHDRFPAQGGLEGASAFKKCANFLCYFIAIGPVLKGLPLTVVSKEINAISNHQNAMIGLHVVMDALEGAKIHLGDEEVLLENRIEFSHHMYVDTVQGISKIQPHPHFHLVSVFLESLSYRFNQGASNSLEI